MKRDDASQSSHQRTPSRPSKLKQSPQRQPLRPNRQRQQQQQQRQRQRQNSVSPAPSIISTSSSISEVKNLFSSWMGNIKAGVTGAWTKAKGEYDTYLATQEGDDPRMARRRKEVLSLHEPVRHTAKSSKNSSVEQGRSIKRPSTSDGSSLPVKRKVAADISLSPKKLRKQTSLGRLAFRKSASSHPTKSHSNPASTSNRSSIASVSNRSSISSSIEVPSTLPRPAGAPVYRGGHTVIPEEEDELKEKLKLLETTVSELRAKVRWFESSYGDIPSEALSEIQLALADSTPRKQRRSVFKEELDTTTADTTIPDQSILPQDIKNVKGFEKETIVSIPEEANDDSLPAETTIKLIQPSPSTKSLVSPPRPVRQTPSSSPTKANISAPSSPPDGLDKAVDLLETLSPIHPNIMPALVPRKLKSDVQRKLKYVE